MSCFGKNTGSIGMCSKPLVQTVANEDDEEPPRSNQEPTSPQLQVGLFTVGKYKSSVNACYDRCGVDQV